MDSDGQLERCVDSDGLHGSGEGLPGSRIFEMEEVAESVEASPEQQTQQGGDTVRGQEQEGESESVVCQPWTTEDGEAQRDAQRAVSLS